jgi:glucokinase
VAGNSIARRFGRRRGRPVAPRRPRASPALEIVDALCRVMGRMLYNMVATLDLQRISLGGSVFWHNRDYLLPRLQAQMTASCRPLTRGVLLVPAGLGDKVGDYAALALLD